MQWHIALGCDWRIKDSASTNDLFPHKTHPNRALGKGTRL